MRDVAIAPRHLRAAPPARRERVSLAVTDLLHRLIAPIAAAPREYGIVLYVAHDGGLLGMRHLAGRRDGVDIAPRAVVADALALECRHVVIAHNHPSGDPTPSADDLALTARLRRTLASVGVSLHDHLIVAVGHAHSMRAADQL